MHLFLSFILLASSFSAFAQDIVITRPYTPHASGMINSSLSLRNFDPAILESHTTSEAICEFDSNINGFVSQFNEIMSDCDNRASDLAVTSDGQHRNRLSAAAGVCACYQSRQNIWGDAYASIERAKQNATDTASFSNFSVLGNALGQLGNGLRTPNAPTPAEVNENIRAESYLLSDLRNGILFQASLLATNSNEMDRLTSGYAQSWMGNSDTTSKIEAIDQTIGTRFQGTNRERLKVPKVERPILEGDTPPDSCVSMRDYMAFRQFPDDNQFYQDLAADSSFGQEEWNYSSLSAKVKSLTQSLGMLTVAEAKRHPEVGPLIRRLDFLHRNPLIKNLFLTNSPQSQNLFNLIRQNLVPQDRNCFTAAAGACQRQAFRSAEKFRSSLAGFFGDPERSREIAVSITDAGEAQFNSRIGQNRNGSALGDRVFTAQHVVTESQIHTMVPGFLETGRIGVVNNGIDLNRRLNLDLDRPILKVDPMLSNPVFNVESLTNPLPIRLNPIESIPFANGNYNVTALRPRTTARTFWSDFSQNLARQNRLEGIVNICPKVISSQDAQPFVMNELERIWAREMNETEINPADGVLTFGEFSQEICEGRNSGPGTPAVSFADFRRQECPVASSCIMNDVRKRYSQRFSHSERNPDALADYSAFRNGVQYRSVPKETAQAIASAAPVSFREYRAQVAENISGRGELYRRIASANPESPVSRALAARTSAQSSSSQQTTSSAQIANQDSVSAAGAVTPIVQPQQVITAPETIRSQLRQSVSEAGEIREEIAELREGNRLSERSGAPVAPDFRSRLSALESGLSEKDKMISDLRGKLAQAGENEDDTEDLPQTPQRNVRRSAVSSASAASAASGTAITPVISSGGGAVSLPSGRQSGRSTPGRSPASGNAALLEKYQQGSIVVNNASDLEALRSRSGAAYEVELTPQQITELSRNDLSSSKDVIERFSKMTGEVFRLSSVDENGQPVEFFVVKSNGQISVLRAEAASRMPASVAPVPDPERAKLIDLETQLRDGGN